jgi:hypothetical protein
LVGGSIILTLGARARLPGIHDLVEFSERGQRVAEGDAFGYDSPVFALVIHQLAIHQQVEPVIDGVLGELDTLSQPHSIRLKQRHVKEFAPVSGIGCGHISRPSLVVCRQSSDADKAAG